MSVHAQRPHGLFPSPAGRVLAGLAVALWFALAAHADVGLVVETPTGPLGFFSDVGHASIWLSRGCLSASGHLEFCDGSPGIVLTSTSYWPKPGAAAIPADLFFLGESLGSGGGPAATWEATLASAYPNVPPRQGRKYLGRAWLRSVRVLRFSTSAEDDRSALAAIDAERSTYRYSYAHRNCAFYAQSVLKHFLGASFHGDRILEFGVLTPRSVERALRRRLRQQGTSYETVLFPGHLWHSWREPPRNICEAAVLDPKYALPLMIYQPYVYAGFAGFYGLIRFFAATANASALSDRSPLASRPASTHEQETRNAFDQLTLGVEEEAPETVESP